MSHLSGVCSNCGKKEEEHFGIYSCEIPPFEVVEQWKHKGSYTWADGEPHSSIVGRVELEYRKIIRLK